MFDNHIIRAIIITEDGAQDGYHNHNVKGILLLKRHSIAAYKQCLIYEMPISCCSHNSEVL